MRRLLVLAIIALSPIGLGSQVHAEADCGGGSSTAVTSDDDSNAVLATGDHNANGCGSDGDGVVSVVTDSGPRDSDLDAICVAQAITLDRDPFEYCDLNTDDPPELTPGMIAAAFQTISLPPSRLLIQPANGRTLVNFATNFYTDDQPFDVPAFRLLGHTIELRVTPQTYTWHYGDGTTEQTSGPGAAYPDLQITHSYLRKGRVGPSLDTTYGATYRVDRAGPWLPVDGTVTVAGPPTQLEVLTATPTLVGFRSS
jgi:hypothetical protein